MTRKQILMSVVSGFAGLFITATASAAVEGPYIGGALGWGDVHQTDFVNKANTASGLNSGLAGRVFAGLQFQPNIAAEMGYSKFRDAKFNSSTTSNAGLTTEAYNATIKSYAVDLVAKIIVPLQNGFNIYGKVGGAYLNEANTSNEVDTITGTTVTTTTSSQSMTLHKVLPTYGLGASFNVNKNVSTDISWMHIQKVGNTNWLKLIA
jgi:opacity protein-like surface antigen